MTDDEAAAIIAATGSRQPQFDELARMVDRITKETRRRLHNAELITDEELDAWESSPYYVPMRGWETNPETASSVGGGRGFDIRGPESHVALGRRSKADNPLYYTILQAQQSIIRSEKSKVLKTLIRTAQTHPDPEMWSINKAEIRRRINPKTGLVESYAVPPQYRHDDNLFRTRIGGKTYWIEIHHEPTARAMRNVGAVDKTNLFLKSGFFLSRTFAALQTQWVPEFVISNAIRDLETAMINITDVDERPNAIRRKMIADAVTLKSVRAIMHGLRNDSPTSEYAKYFEEFRLAGGKMAMVDFQTIDQIRDRLQADVKGRNKVGRGIMWALEAIGDVNTAFENGVRLSTYIALRKPGVSKAKSAFIARELTVNFSRRGTASPYINMAYIFFNAATQGTFRLGQALYKSKKVRMAYAGIFMFGVLVDQLNSMLAPDDDDEGQNPYDSIPDWERERNLILMVPGTSEYVKIPIAYGYNAPFFMGQQT